MRTRAQCEVRSARRSALTGSRGLLNERSEEGELLGVAAGHSLGVPLDREEEAARAFDTLDHPIGSNGAHREIRRQITDDLVVGAGHGHLSGVDDLGEAGTRRDGNRMNRVPTPLPWAHVGGIGPCTIGEVLIEAAAKRDVEDLKAATDP